MAELRGRSIRALSRGERQCLAIAAVLAMGPRILVLDEPTSSLDVTSTLKVMEALARLSAEGTTIIVIEHRLGQVAQLARRAILMDEGKVIADGTATSVFSDHALLRRLGLRRPAPERQEDWAAAVASQQPAFRRADCRNGRDRGRIWLAEGTARTQLIPLSRGICRPGRR